MPHALLHVRTNVPPWRSDTLLRLDEVLCESGSSPIDIAWHVCEFVKGDANHFTRRGIECFLQQLVDATAERAGPRLHVVADSTIDHNDWTGERHHRWASLRLMELYRFRGINASVDAVRGSGFVARAREGLHFHARLSDVARRGERVNTVLFVGGWNDATSGHAPRRVWDAAVACVRLTERIRAQ